ncbi:protein of unknown function [Methylacidimicrobium sp. AP8]|nr:protein of unknown function [Methylacidimicrobium sp. AP8]
MLGLCQGLFPRFRLVVTFSPSDLALRNGRDLRPKVLPDAAPAGPSRQSGGWARRSRRIMLIGCARNGYSSGGIALWSRRRRTGSWRDADRALGLISPAGL